MDSGEMATAAFAHRGRRWFVVATQPRAEALALQHLQRQGYRTFAPTLCVKKRRAGRWVEVTEALFSGYLFVELDLGIDDPAPIRSTKGCRGLVRFGLYPAPVPSEVIEPLQRSSSVSGHAPSPFKKGDPVRIEAGPFVGLNAVFDMAKGEDRAHVLLTILGQRQRITVDENDLYPHRE